MNRKPLIASLVVLALVLLYGSFYYGKTEGTKEGQKEYAPLVDMAFPKPPDDIRQLSGTIQNIQGATLYLAINSITDYLPHTDGTPRKTEIRYVTVTNQTKISSIETTKFDTNGDPLTKDISFSDLKTGMNITVSASENIRNVEKFDATSIRIVQ